MFYSIILFLLTIITTNTVVYSWRPCPELSPALRFPCRCNVELFGAKFQSAAIAMNCDFVVFQGESPPIPHGAPIISYSQRYSGQHTLPTQLFNVFDLPIGNVDFSHNYIRRLPEKIFSGIQDSLITLHLSDNLLGDSLNPIFSTSEFRILNVLRVLDLSGNKIKALEEGIFIGCENLQELYLDRNSFTAIPSLSLNGPSSLKTLSLAHNNIVQLNVETFNAQLHLEKIDLRYNRITTIDGGAFSGLIQPKEIYLAGNLLSRLNSDVFNGATPIQKIDLSENFITIFPTIALQELDNLKVLNLSSNMIQKLNATNLDVLKSLQILDLSKNNIATVPPATFRDLKLLKYLDLSLNSLRTIEDDALEGLDSLQTLIIRDNNILLIPGSALGRLPRLSNLYLDFNRIAALSSEILGSIQPEDIKYMSLSRNVIRELPPGSFRMFKNLRYLDLSGNSLATVNSEIFVGLESALIELRLTQNRITTIGGGGGGPGTSMEFHKLKLLDLSDNNIEDIPENAFMDIQSLLYLNISNNMHLSPIPGQLLNALTKLKIIDLSNVGLKELPLELFENNSNLEMIYLKENGLTEILEGSFTNLRNCSTIDLSHNNIITIKSKSFVNLMNIRKLNLKGNQLNAFKGEFFNTGSGLEKLDISDNLITYLYPSSFRIHPRLQSIMAANNKLPVFPAELIISLQYLEYINLAGNQLKTIDELNFARLPRLRTLLLADNHLESLSEMAFHNSTQLQYIDLSENRLERIGERTFEGLVRLGTLNLERNNLTELPDTIFDRTKLQMLENIILAHNQFEMAPLKSIQKQYFFVDHVDLSYNRIKYIPLEDSTMVNIKNLDLSFNPLSEQTVTSILNEPKTVRSLNLAGTGIRELKTLETPFLAHLNISHNEIKRINESVFERTTLLENLDLSNNQLDGFQELTKIWPLLINLKHLNLSNNPFTIIANGDFDQLPMLTTLTVTDLTECTRIEKGAFKNLPNLSKLNAYNYPRLGYLDVQGIVEYLPTLTALNIEIKDSTVGTDQIQPAKHPRLNEIGLHGDRLRTISTGTLAGLKSKDLNVKLYNTSINAIPAALLLPVPRSSNLNLDISGSKITVLPPQLLSALEDRRNSIVLHGLDNNPIHCDCNARALRRWLPTTRMTNLKCTSPEYLKNRRLIEVGDDELTCDPKRMTSTTVTTTTSTTARTHGGISSVIEVTSNGVFPGTAIPPTQRGILMRPMSTQTVEPEIIWSMPPSTPPSIKLKTKSPTLMKSPNQRSNDDTLIIGIVCGVVAFIFILIIIICIIRLRMTGNDTNSYNRYASHNMAMNGMPALPMGPGSIQVGYKGANQHMHNGNNGGGGHTGPIHAIQTANGTALYAVPPYANHSYATLPHKGMMASSQHPSQTNLSQIRTTYSTMGRLPPTYHYQSQQQLQQQQHHQQQQQQQQQQHQLQQSQQQQQQQHSLNGQPYIIYSDDKSFR